MNDDNIRYPVDTTKAEWCIWDDQQSQIVARNRRWPRVDGMEIVHGEHIWWLREIPVEKPDFNHLTSMAIEASPIIDKGKNECSYSWQVVPIDPSTARSNILRHLYDQVQGFYDHVRGFTRADLTADDTEKLKEKHQFLQYLNAQDALEETADADLHAVPLDLDSYELTERQTAETLLRQETEILMKDATIREAGGEPMDETDLAETQARVAHNQRVVAGAESSSVAPERGAQRGRVALPREKTAIARFSEHVFSWSEQGYYIPVVRFSTIPDGINKEQLFAMVYDANNVYRSWMPFTQNEKGEWQTPSDVNYIAIAKTQSAHWRVAIAYKGTDQNSEITDRVLITPPDVERAKIRWSADAPKTTGR